jgi:hypothetical protein
MGIDVEIWHGDVVVVDPTIAFRADARGFVTAEMYDDETYPLLSGIDPYGDTIFNYLQLPRLIKELERRFETMDVGLERRAVGKVLGLARESLDARGRPYLVFVGD